MTEPLATFVEVVLPLPLHKLYTYRVPTELINEVEKGKRVIVQFGKKKFYSALIHATSNTPPKDYEAKYINTILDDEPIISEHQFRFWHWISSYYLCSLGDVMKAALPAVFKLESETLVMLNPDCELDSIQLTDKEFLITEALTLAPHLSISEINNILDVKNVFTILKGLYTKGVIVYTEDIKETYKPKTVTCINLADEYTNDKTLSALFDSLEKSPKQLDVLMALMHLKHQTPFVTKKQLLAHGGYSDSSLNTLIKNNILVTYKHAIDRLIIQTQEVETFTLNTEQESAYQLIKNQFLSKDVVLLHGITSSGKTHVYVKLIEEQIALGKQVLFLLPEIALTSQIVQRIRKYFGDKALSFHSKFSQNERVEIWQKVNSGNPLVIIGARSSIFLPFKNLGLIIVDEEHETSYKQQDPAPRYHARDAAIFLAYTWQAKTLLGSATPSFESYHNAKTDKFGLVELLNRFGTAPLPEMLIGDVSEDTRTKSMHGYLTKLLYNAIEETLQANQQVILFQNRRGYAPILECQTCNWMPRCINCDINLTYHKYNDSMKCHYCGYTSKTPSNCVACGSHNVVLKGFGTEKIEDEIKIQFPKARVLRLDLEASKSKHGHEQIINSFENHEADILIGTQMLSKGLDFGNVSLVGVINADQLLYFPDFRAHERAYQLLTQVGGRAGRKSIQGKVIIQSSTPNHHVLKEVLAQRYQVLYANEVLDREKFKYPPHTRLIKLTIKHREYNVCELAAFSLQKLLFKRLGENVIGPESPYVGRARNMYIKEILIKIDKASPYLGQIKQYILKCMEATITDKNYKSTIVFADVDPF
ncbi:MAG: primosomal protein N' [Bacteroidia bacterium]|nr:primosomal protein N' [Bacteroidia bacterium]